MPDPSKLPHLLKLLTDESLSVQQALGEAFAEFGPDLDLELSRLHPPPTSAERLQIQALLDSYARKVLRERWPEWLSLSTQEEQIENALTLIAEFQNGPLCSDSASDLLDALAREFLESYEDRTPMSLADFLFKDKQYCGAREDYENPLNSNLIYVMREKKGIPISLVLLYVLVGARVQIPIETCNFPRHFLARVRLDDQVLFVDCFNGGVFYSATELSVMMHTASAEYKGILEMNPDPEMIMKRVLSNLIAAYESRGDHENSQLMYELLQVLDDSPEM